MKPKYKGTHNQEKTEHQAHPARRSERLIRKQVAPATSKISTKNSSKPVKKQATSSSFIKHYRKIRQIHRVNKDENKKQNTTKSKRKAGETLIQLFKKSPGEKESSKPDKGANCATTSEMTEVGKEEVGPVSSDPKNVQYKHVTTFTTERHFYTSANSIRFCDAAFIDDDHILVCDDGRAEPGFRVCCLRLDGTQVADLRFDATPWTVLVLSPTEAVVTLRFTDTRGLGWLSIDTERGIIECTKTIRMENDVYGIAYNKCDEIFVVSHHLQKFLTILNRDGETIGHVPVVRGLDQDERLGHLPVVPESLIRCAFVGKDIMYLSHCGKYIKVVDMEANEKSTIKHPMLTSPCDFELDSTGNLYVVNSGNPGNVCLFDREGNYIKTLLKQNQLRGIGLNSSGDKLVVTYEQFISVYELHK